MSLFTGISSTVLQERLVVAQDAYHELSVGAQAVSIRLGEKTVTFTPADQPRLGQYIRDLQGAIAALAGDAPRKGFNIVGGKGL